MHRATKDYRIILISSYEATLTDIAVNGVSMWENVSCADRTYCLFVDGKKGDVIHIDKPRYYDWVIVSLLK